tara:strand:- start:26016 stop:27005 length:990 start_codon:yes stop_codon:yes gene_type:complete
LNLIVENLDELERFNPVPSDFVEKWNFIIGGFLKKYTNPLTRECYESDIALFIKFLHMRFNFQGPDLVEVEHITEFLEALRETLPKRPDGTINLKTLERKKSSIKALFKHLHENGRIKKNPAKTLKSENIPLKTVSKYIPRDEVIQLIDAPSDEKFSEVRNSMMIKTYAETATRNSSVRLLVHDDLTGLSMDPPQIKMAGKGTKGEKEVYRVSVLLKEAFLEYLEIKKLKYGDPGPNDFVFPSRKGGGPVARRHASRIFSNYAKEVLGRDDLRLHCFRKTQITNFYKETKDIKKTLAFSKHKDIRMLMAYILDFEQNQLEEVDKISFLK